MKRILKFSLNLCILGLLLFPFFLPVKIQNPPFYFIVELGNSIQEWWQRKPHNLSSSQIIDESKLKAKIALGLPAWAMAQITEDLARFKKIHPKDFTAYINDPKLECVRFKIKNGKVIGFNKENTPFTCDNVNLKYDLHMTLSGFTVCDMAQYLAKKGYLPDTDFLLATYDYINLQSPQKPLPILTFAKDKNNPMENFGILNPDWMNLKKRAKTSQQVQQGNAIYPWAKKEKKVFWRGGPYDSTGFREKLVAFSKLNPEIVDARFTYKKKDAVKSIPIPDHLKYKYLISIDGERCAWERLVWHLESNSLTLKLLSSQVQWFYKGLSPFVHYVPVKNESDLLKKVAWAEAHPLEVEHIIQNANSFVKDNLSIEDMYHYFLVLMQEYNKKLVIE